MRIPFPFFAAMFFVANATAQPVYESRDRAGPVFSDMPSQGASELALPPINVMDSPQLPPAAPAPAAAPAVPYTALRIIQPENGGTIHSNTGEFLVQAELAPALRTRQGDAVAVKLDGTLLPNTHTDLSFQITSSEWQMAAKDNAEHRLEVAVVDRTGNARIISDSVRFYVHRATRQCRLVANFSGIGG
jgi:hypothetical protein